MKELFEDLQSRNLIELNRTYQDENFVVEDVNKLYQLCINQIKKEENKFNLRDCKKTLSTLKRQLKQIRDTEDWIENYNYQIEKLEDSLVPIQILNDQKNQIARSYETTQIIDALTKSLAEIKKADLSKVRNTIISDIDKKRIEIEIKDLEIKVKELSESDHYFSVSDSVFIIDRKRQIDETYSQLKKLDKIEIIENYIEIKQTLLAKIGKLEEVKNSIKESIEESIQKFYNQLNYMANYASCKTVFDEDRFRLKLKGNSNVTSYEYVGSKSNYMFMHLVFFLGLHKLFLGLEKNYVLPFLFIDQPSIPYYSGSEKVNEDDKDKLMDAFNLLDKFISTVNNENKDFQILMIEHAPKSYWMDSKNNYILKNFHTVKEFVNGEKLIPQNIIDAHKK